MSEMQESNMGANVPAEDLNGPQIAASMNLMEKYGDERDKRIRAEGVNQYIDLRRSEKYNRFVEDPWVKPSTPINTPVPDGGTCKALIVGAGLGGILFAVKLIKAGFSAEDLVIVDPAGGFGGTWYFNRYPGLMCDIESYIYLPLLEEMGYIPKRRYASGSEIREYAESICAKYGLHKRAMFQSAATSMIWDEDKNQWVVKITKKPKGGKESVHTVHANFINIAPGTLTDAKLPAVNGIDKYKGPMFHTARWDYSLTGGSSDNPELTGLSGKRVAIVGTGATAVQAVPSLTKYAGHLYVFQRTPSSVDVRGNRDTDPEWFKTEVAKGEKWQRERALNFTSHIENMKPKPLQNLIDDGWTHMPSYSGLIGTPNSVTMDNVTEHIGELHELDAPRQMRLHGRVDEIVENPDTANGLKAWYPSWCKRPCFHDEYLQTFNSPNVSLVDTEGRGVSAVTERGIEFDGKEYEVDIIIWSTGFRSPLIGGVAGKTEITIIGRNGVMMEDVHNQGELLTLHGVASRGFPNLFWPGPLQAGVSANFTFVLDVLTTHIAYIAAKAVKLAGGGSNPVVEPTSEAQDQWALQIMSGAATFAAMSGCTPGYLNREGEVDRLTPEQQMRAAKNSIWPNGFHSYLDLIEKWRADDRMEGLEVTCKA